MLSFDINEDIIRSVFNDTTGMDDENTESEEFDYSFQNQNDGTLHLIPYLEMEFKKHKKKDQFYPVSSGQVTNFFHQNCPEILYLEESITDEFYEYSTIYKLPNGKYVKLFRCHEFNSNGYINEDLYKYMKHNRYVEVVPIDLMGDVYEEQSTYLEKFKLLKYLEYAAQQNYPDKKITDDILREVLNKLPLMENSNVQVEESEVTYDSVHEIPEQDIFVKINHKMTINKDGKLEENPIDQIRKDCFKEVIQKKKLIITYKEL